MLLQTGKAASLLFLLCGILRAQALPGWVLTFSDEFTGKELEFPKWSPNEPFKGGARTQAQAWTPAALQLAEGILHVTARREPARYEGRDRSYTSGIVTTFGSFAQTYGRFEIRCRIPAGQGVEARFWLLPVPSGEIPSIDVVTAIGSDPRRSLFANRWGDMKTERSYSGAWNAPDLSKDFHTFAIEWDKDKIVWFADGKERFRSVDGVPHQPLYLAVSLVVGGVNAKWPDSTTPFPASFDIDYIRAYQRP